MQSKKGLNVLSIFDGMSCGQIALNRAGISYDKYYASELDKYAITVTQANYPDTIQLGDVTKWREWGIDWAGIDLLIGGSPCFVSGTKIITRDTLTPIEDVRVGDEVLTHKGVYRKVLRVGGKTSEIYELQSQSGTLTETTDNHPYYVRKRSKVWNNENRSYEFKFNEPEFVKVKDLTEDHYLATPILKSSKNPMDLTEDECFLIGLYIGDGHTRKDFRKTEGRDNHRHWQLIISVGEHEKDLFSEKVKLKHSFYKHTMSTYRAVFSSKRLVSYVEEQCGCSSHTKHFGKGILDLPVHLLKKVIEGYLFADGSSRRDVHRATTVSRSLVESLTLAVAKTFRTATSVEYTTRPKTTEILGRVVNQSDTWTISFSENHPKQSRSWVIGDFIWNPIKKLIKTDKKKSVFNLEVEEDNSYVANNHVVHNCQGFSFAGKQLAFDDPRSKLFFVYVDILNHIRSVNPDVKFMLENVKMKKEYLDVISEQLGVQPVFVNSALVSAQNRQRYYWANWEFGQPGDKGIVLADVIEDGGVDRDKAHCIDANYFKGGNLKSYFGSSRRQLVFTEKSLALLSTMYKENAKSMIKRNKKGWLVLDEDLITYRKLTPTECERLQTVLQYIKPVEIVLCSDQAKSFVSAVEKNPKLLKLVSSAGSEELKECAKLVSQSMSASQALTKYIAPQSADMRMRKQTGKCTRANQEEQSLIVNNAESITTCKQAESEEGSAIQPVFITITEGKITHHGKEASPQKDKNYTQVMSGKIVLSPYGNETMQNASDALSVLEMMQTNSHSTSITSFRLSTKNLEQMLAISYWFAKSAIGGFTQDTTQKKTLFLTLIDGYTAHVSNTQRYRMLGNGWTVDVIAHIFNGLLNKNS